LSVADDDDMLIENETDKTTFNDNNNYNTNSSSSSSSIINSNDMYNDGNSDDDSNSDSDSDSDFEDDDEDNNEHIKKIRNKNLTDKVLNKESSNFGYFYNPNNLKILFGVTDKRIKKVKKDKEQISSNSDSASNFGLFSSNFELESNRIYDSHDQEQLLLDISSNFESNGNYNRVQEFQYEGDGQFLNIIEPLRRFSESDFTEREIILIDDSDDEN
jgi:hypothetical protein